MTEVEIFPAAGRSVTHGQSAGVQERGGTGRPGIETRHSFAFGAHYDPKNTGFGLLVAHNDESLEPGAGFDMHPHRDAEIVTWVAEGTVRHIDSLGHDAQLGPGTVAWQGAGSGIVHSERNASAGQGQPARFIQVWLTPDEFGLEPGYASAQVKLRPNELTLIAGAPQGRAEGAAADIEGEDSTSGEEKGLPLRIRQRHAAFYAARLEPGGSINLVPARYTHVFVVSGVIRIDGTGLEAGDAARITAAGDGDGDAGELQVQCLDDAEILVWYMEKSTRDLLS